MLVAGTGALGASLALHMVRAGVGSVRLIDRDYVELSNLQRQGLFDEADARAAQPKAVAAAAKLRNINSGVSVEAHVAEIRPDNAYAWLEGIDLALDGTDNAETRLALSDACWARGIPFVYGGVAGGEGMTAALVPGETACLRCLIGGAAEGGRDDRNCDAVGVIAPAVEAVAALQAAEALKWLSGGAGRMRRTWVALDVWDFSVRAFKLPGPRAGCAVCGDGAPGAGPGNRTARETGDEPGSDRASGAKAVLLCGRDTVQVTMDDPVPLAQAKERLVRAGGALLAENAYLLKWELPEGERIVLFDGGRALVQGAADEDRAVRLITRHLLEWRRDG